MSLESKVCRDCPDDFCPTHKLSLLCPQCRRLSIRRAKKQWKTKNPERTLETNRRAASKFKHKNVNPERYALTLEKNREYLRQNPDIYRAQRDRFNARRRGTARYDVRKREKRLRLCTPPWVDHEQLKKIYQNRPDGFHVDHIIPIKGENVSGLHVPWNLQYLPAVINMSKGNKIEVAA